MTEKIIQIEATLEGQIMGLETYSFLGNELQFIFEDSKSKTLATLLRNDVYEVVLNLLNQNFERGAQTIYHDLVRCPFYLFFRLQIIKKANNTVLIQLDQIQIFKSGTKIDRTNWISIRNDDLENSSNELLGLIITDREGTVRYANQDIHSVLGDPFDTIQNQNIFTLFQVDSIREELESGIEKNKFFSLAHIIGIYDNSKPYLLYCIITKDKILIYVSAFIFFDGSCIAPSYLSLACIQTQHDSNKIVFITDAQDIVVDISSHIFEFTRYHFWEIIGLPASQFYESESSYNEVMHLLEAHGSVDGYYIELVGADGELITSKLSSQLNKAGSSFIGGTHGSLTFVGKIHAQSQPNESQRELLRKIIFSLPYPVCVLDQKQCIVIANQKFLELFDLENHKIMGKSAMDITHMASVFMSHPKIMERGLSFSHTFQDTDANSQFFLIHTSVFYHPVSLEKLVLLSFKDQTQEVVYREEIKAKTQYQNLIINIASEMVNIPDSDVYKVANKALKSICTYLNMSVGLLLTEDSENDERLEVKSEWFSEDLNRNKVRVLRKKIDKVYCEKVLKHNLADSNSVFLYDVEELEPDLIQDYLIQKGIKKVIISHLNHQGSSIGYLLWGKTDKHYSFKEDEKNVIKLFVNIFTSAVIRSRFEKNLLEATEMAQSANRAKTDFLANMTHEIRTPMNGILGISELLSHTNLTQEQKDFIHIIQSSGEALMNIVNDVLDLSKIEARSLELNNSEFNLIQNVENVLELLAPKTNTIDKQIELCYLIDSNVPVNVIGDSGRFQQILINLINNAIKFTHKGHVKLLISVLKENRDFFTLEFKVKDTGIGIQRNKMKELFKPFNQLENTISIQYGGTGLGLTITKELVEKMNGSISVDSIYGEGSTFTFTVDFKKHQSNSEVFAHNVSSNGKTVMIIDDNPVNLLLLDRILSSLGYGVIKVSNAQDAIYKLKKATMLPDALIVDHVMADIDGIELCLYLSEIPELNNIPTVLLSSLTRFADKDLISQAGIKKHLRKPIRKAVISDVLNQLVFSKTTIDKGLGLVTKAQNKHVLLVEDNNVNQLVVSSMLNKIGFKTTIAENGQDAIQKLLSHDIDLVLMDCRLPIMNGFDATKEIRLGKAGNHNKDILIIGLSASALTEDREACLQAGMNDYLSKPVRMNQLEQTILQNAHQEHNKFDEVLTLRTKSMLDSQQSDLESSVDFSEVEELADGDFDFLFELKKTFKETTLQDIELLKKAITELDYKQIVALSHKIVAPCRHFGLLNIAKNLKQVENSLLKVDSKEERRTLIELIQLTTIHLERLVSDLTVSKIEI